MNSPFAVDLVLPAFAKHERLCHRQVNQVSSARNRLAYQMECDGCNVILASAGDVPRVVEILASGKKFKPA